MAFRNPIVPKFVQCRSVRQVSQINEDLEKILSVTSKQSQTSVNLREDLGDLTCDILLRIVRNFDEIGGATMDYDI